LAGLMLVGVICGFVMANITSIKDLSVKIAGIAEINASVKTLQSQVAVQSQQIRVAQENAVATAKLATESQLALSKVLSASPLAARFSPAIAGNVAKLAEIAVPEPAARAHWLGELQAKYH
jgi:tRNA(Phe) wybutosine-synthesizing methylase Tyw3